MTRLVLISDSHGRQTDFETVCRLHPEATWFVFLGDGAGEFERIKAEHPEWPLVGVKGNCDYGSRLPADLILVVGNKRILCTHGNAYAVKSGTWMLEEEASKRGCSAVFYGHTHHADSSYEDGLLLVNPGALSDWYAPRYAIVDVADNGVMVPSLCVLSAEQRGLSLK